MSIEDLNMLHEAGLKEKLQQCCGSSRWIYSMVQSRPFQHANDLLAKADLAWSDTSEKDWLEAFSHHPKIGDLKSIETKFASTKSFAKDEQGSVTTAMQEVLKQLAQGNALYEKKFGFIFIVCATGKSAEEMLHLLNDRLSNDRDAELKIAAAEQLKITKLRLQKLIS